MFKLPFVLLYTAMTFFAWGVYGILLNHGQAAMGKSYMKPFVGVGFAYFVIAVLGAGAMLGGKPEKGHWSFLGTVYSLIAGSVGALGALGVILALAFGGDPVYVMPLIFGGAPVVNTLFTSWLGKTFHKITPLFVIGMVLVGVGMIGVLRYKPHAGTAKHTEPAKTAAMESSIPGKLFASFNAAVDSEVTTPATAADTEVTETKVPNDKKVHWISVFLSIVMAVICWGSYGPVLHLGQMKMGGSRLRPFICVGLAYFVIAVAMPLSLLSIDRTGSFWSLSGMLWSIAAGTAGAIGALGIIMAFNSGGKPIFVMPLVFGFAPVINTIVTLLIQHQLHTVDPVFLAALGTVILGAVMVLIFAPKAGHAPPTNSDFKSEPSVAPEAISQSSPAASRSEVQASAKLPTPTTEASPPPWSASSADAAGNMTPPTEPKP